MKTFLLALITTIFVMVMFWFGIRDIHAFTMEEVISLTNQARTENKVEKLKVSEQLNRAAQAKASDEASKGYFAHKSPEGKEAWGFIRAEKYEYIMAGENLAVDFHTPEAMVIAWLNSPTHRANLLKKEYEETGFGIAEGSFQGHTAIYVVQMFGVPSTVITPTPSLIKIKSAPQPKSLKKTVKLRKKYRR